METEPQHPGGPGWTTDHVDIRMELDPSKVVVRSRLSVRSLGRGSGDGLLYLDGEGLTLLELRVDGARVRGEDFRVEPSRLAVDLGTRTEALVETKVTVVPGEPHSLGLVVSPGLINTALEPTGLRRITYCMDSPSVRSTYSVTVVSDPNVYPDVLSNGRLVVEAALPDGRLARTFEDPVPKPSYLLAVLAGSFATRSTTISPGPEGQVEVAVVADPSSIDGSVYALELIEKVMSFDLGVGGIPYDLDRLIMAAVPRYPDATEYHGLMFFEPSLLVLDPRGWTDDDVLPILANVSHEYLHHTRGNRVTVSAWEQLALKEGLTVLAQGDFRNLLEGPVARIDEVAYMRRVQFPEEEVLAVAAVPFHLSDAQEAYNRTAYLKAAETFRMLRRVAGVDAWDRAVEAFHRRYDLSAATVDDFVATLQSADPGHHGEFDAIARWFRLIGRPAVSVDVRRREGGLELMVERTDGIAEDEPVAIPLEIAFLNPDGTPCRAEVDGVVAPSHQVLLTSRSLKRDVGTRSDAIVSALRGFSAPVDLKIDHTVDDLGVLVVHETDAYARWAAAQELKLRAVDAHRAGDDPLARKVSEVLGGALEEALKKVGDPAVTARLLELPGEVGLGNRCVPVDVDGVHQGVTELAATLGRFLGSALLDVIERGGDDPGSTEPADRAIRYLADSAMALLIARGTPDDWDMATHVICAADPTRSIRTLAHALSAGHPKSEELIFVSEERWRNAPRLLDRWTRAQTGAARPETIDRVRRLVLNPRYDRTDRNRVMAVWFPFCTENRVAFHDVSGTGYEALVDELEPLLEVNPGLVPRLVPDLLQLHRFDKTRQELMRKQLERARSFRGVSGRVLHVIDQILAVS